MTEKEEQGLEKVSKFSLRDLERHMSMRDYAEAYKIVETHGATLGQEFLAEIVRKFLAEAKRFSEIPPDPASRSGEQEEIAEYANRCREFARRIANKFGLEDADILAQLTEPGSV